MEGVHTELEKWTLSYAGENGCYEGLGVQLLSSLTALEFRQNHRFNPDLALDVRVFHSSRQSRWLGRRPGEVCM